MTRLTVISTAISLLISNLALADPSARQVLIETRIITTTDDFADDLGVRFGLDLSDNSGNAANPPSFPGSFFGPPSGGLGLSGVLSDPQFEVILRAMEKNTDKYVISEPRVTTASSQHRSPRIYPSHVTPKITTTTVSPSANPRAGWAYNNPTVHVTPTVTPEGLIELDINTGSFFRSFEKTFDLFSGAALGNMSQTETRTHTHQETIVTEREDNVNQMVGVQPVFNGMYWVDVPIYEQQRVVTQQEETITRVETEEFMRGAFQDQATIYGMRCTYFCGLYFGMGALVQYMDGDLHGAWAGELQGIARYPIEFRNWAFAPYVVTGAGVFLSTDNYPTFSLGGGLEIRTSPNIGLFTEARQTWTDDSNMSFTNVIGGIRFVTDGRGPRRGRTKVSVESGQTVVLGGLLDSSAGEQPDKLPLLGNIPIIGNLFRRRESSRERENLLIFVKARIIEGE